MKVSKLIKELKKMPQNVEVGISHGDNYKWEIAGWAENVEHHTKEEHVDDVEKCSDKDSKDIFKDNPKEWVTIHC